MANRKRSVEALGVSSLFAGSFAGRRVLVTGHTGFKGSWLALWLTSLGAEVGGLALDPEDSDSHWSVLGLELATDARIDLRDAQAVKRVLDQFRPEVVFHLAAQALVRPSYRDPEGTFAVNVGGLVNLLEAIRACDSVKVVINATTDKVYQPPCPRGGHVESDPLGGHDPYSSSKACAELVSDSYRRSFFRIAGTGGGGGTSVRLATARAGNVIGGGDQAEGRLVPDLVRAAASGKPLRIRNPGATRPWQHVLEPLSGYLRLAQCLLQEDDFDTSWNFGPASDATLSVAALVERMSRYWPSLMVERDSDPQPHEAEHLSLDCSKAASALGWTPVWDAEQTIERTLYWYLSPAKDRRTRSLDDLSAYVEDARRAGQAWTA